MKEHLLFFFRVIFNLKEIFSYFFFFNIILGKVGMNWNEQINILRLTGELNIGSFYISDK